MTGKKLNDINWYPFLIANPLRTNTFIRMRLRVVHLLHELNVWSLTNTQQYILYLYVLLLPHILHDRERAGDSITTDQLILTCPITASLLAWQGERNMIQSLQTGWNLHVRLFRHYRLLGTYMSDYCITSSVTGSGERDSVTTDCLILTCPTSASHPAWQGVDRRRLGH